MSTRQTSVEFHPRYSLFVVLAFAALCFHRVCTGQSSKPLAVSSPTKSTHDVRTESDETTLPTGRSDPNLQSPSGTSVDALESCVNRAIRFLQSKQREDGAIIDRQYDTTMTSLAIMAMASTGVTPADRNEAGRCMQRALDFVLRRDRQDEDGYFGNRDGSRMYGHGITTLMLTELLGMGANDEQDHLIHMRCQKAINLILSAQKQSKPSQFRGGWRYTPNSSDSDLSVSVWQLMALRSAKNDGLDVPASAIDEAIEYLTRSYTARLDNRGRPVVEVAGFSYVPGQSTPSYTMTAAGLLAMQVCGRYESPLVKGSADWLLKNPPKWTERFFFYGTYYYAQGMHQRGGEHALVADRLVHQILLPKQNNDGSWSASSGEEAGNGQVYTTSLAVLSLSVKYHYLPIYQR